MNSIKQLETLKDILTNRCEIYKDRVAFLEKDKITRKFVEIKYIKVKEDSFALGTVLIKDLNLKDKKIALIGENSYKWYITYMSTVCGVGVIVPFDRELPANEVENLMKRSESDCIIYSSREKEKIESIKDNLSDNVIYIEMDKEKSDDISLSFNELLKKGYEYLDKEDNTYEDIEIDPEKFCTLLYTSGTTAEPKGVMLCHKNFVSNIKFCEVGMPPVKDLRYFSILPMHHTYEFMINYLNTISKGCSVIISEGIKYFLKDIKETSPHILVVVPLIIEKFDRQINKTLKQEGIENKVKIISKIVNTISKVGIDFRRIIFKKIIDNFGGRLKYIFCGGAPISKEIVEKMQSYGFVFMQGYGLTETAPLVVCQTPQNTVAGTVGKPIIGVEVRIDLDEGQKEGEIIIKGPNVMLGYYKNEEETNKVLKKGWFYTGDIGHFDNMGNLVISGRSKNVIVTQNGKKIFPEELEFLINQIPLVGESMVYGKIDKEDKNDVTLTARVTLDEEYISDTYGSSRPSDEEIYNIIWNDIKEINRSLVTYKAVKNLEIKKEDFEKTASLKIKRQVELKRNRM